MVLFVQIFKESKMVIVWVIIIAGVLLCTLDMQLSKLSQQIKDLRIDLDIALSSKIEESERAIINAIEDLTPESAEPDFEL